MSLRVVLVDDHALYRDGLRSAILAAGMDVVGEAGNAKDACALVPNLKPDVAVLDVGLPDLDGITAVRELVKQHPGQPALILTTHSHQHLAQRAFEAGAKGFALKAESTDDIIKAIQTVARGETYLADELKQRVEETGDLSAERLAFEGLSPREREVFTLVVGGATTRQIAAKLFISAKTVESHRTHIYTKLGMHSVVQLFRFALRHNLA